MKTKYNTQPWTRFCTGGKTAMNDIIVITGETLNGLYIL